jgi:hypothetical protein
MYESCSLLWSLATSGPCRYQRQERSAHVRFMCKSKLCLARVGDSLELSQGLLAEFPYCFELKLLTKHVDALQPGDVSERILKVRF